MVKRSSKKGDDACTAKSLDKKDPKSQLMTLRNLSRWRKVVAIFEVTPFEGSADRHLELAVKLRPLLAGRHGFIRAERFQSLSDAGKLLSINVWEDEQASMEW